MTAMNGGEELAIAIPVTFDFPEQESRDEQLQWFLDSMPDVAPAMVRSWRLGVMWSHLCNRGGSLTDDASAMTLSNRVGEPIDERYRLTLPAYSIRCFIATLGTSSEFTGSRPPRWPGGKMVYAKRESDR